jgi:bifunctional non-homologous end joining protein LigD
LAIGGFKIKDGRFDGIFVGRRQGKDLIYAGKVEHGFEDDDVKLLRKRLEALTRKTQPFRKAPGSRGVWVEPKVLAEIEYRAKSADGRLRHPFYKGLREDL